MDSRTAVDPERVEAVCRAAAARAAEAVPGREFATFQCGSVLPRELRRAHPRAQAAWRQAVRAGLRPKLEAAWPGKRHDTVAADLFVDALPDALDADVRFAPLLVAGRYRKLARGIAQTVFHCRKCRGRPGGCDACGGTGLLVAESVEEFVRPAIQRAVEGTRSAFHGAGREDVDVRMLGNGRPFVVSVESPVRRSIDPDAVARAVETASGGRVVVEGLRVVHRAEMKRVTTEHGRKTYRATVETSAEAGFPADAAERVRALVGAVLSQRTPHRVDARRADLVRKRTVLEAAVEESGPRRLVLVLRTDPGTYVKELVTGDEGRTVPSVAGLLGVPCVCTELDVLAVGDDAEPATAAAPEPGAHES